MEKKTLSVGSLVMGNNIQFFVQNDELDPIRIRATSGAFETFTPSLEYSSTWPKRFFPSTWMGRPIDGWNWMI